MKFTGPKDGWMCRSCLCEILPFYNLVDKNDLIETTSNINMVDIHHVQNFNPFEINENENALPTTNMDPDVQYFNRMYQHGFSDYFTEDTLIQKCTHLSISPICFSLIHLNIRSTKI